MSGTRPCTRPPSANTSLISRELMYVYCSAGIMNTVSIFDVQPRFISAIWNSNSKSDTARRPADDDLRLAPRDVVDEQAVERVHFDVRLFLEDRPRDLDPLGHREQRRLLRVHQDRDDDPIEQARAARDDVHVTVGQRIERPGIDG